METSVLLETIRARGAVLFGTGFVAERFVQTLSERGLGERGGPWRGAGGQGNPPAPPRPLSNTPPPCRWGPQPKPTSPSRI